MKLSRKGALALMAEEAISLGAYQDSAKVWTIGIGHTAFAGEPKPKAGMRLTLDECVALFLRDVVKYEGRVNAAITVPLQQHEFDALVLFDYNTGAIASGSVDDKLNRGDVKAALATMAQYNKANGKVLPGLEMRRAREAAMFSHGDYHPRAIALYASYPVGRSMLDPLRVPFPDDEPAPVPPPPDVEAPDLRKVDRLPPLADHDPRETEGLLKLIVWIIGLAFAAVAAWLGYDFSGGGQ